MESKKNILWIHSMNYGLIAGGAYILTALLFLFINPGIVLNGITVWLVIVILAMTLGADKYLKKAAITTNTFFKAYLTGLLICFFANIVAGFYNFLYYYMFNREAFNKMLQDIQENSAASGVNGEIGEYITPLNYSLSIIIFLTLFGSIIAIFTALFIILRRKKH